MEARSNISAKKFQNYECEILNAFDSNGHLLIHSKDLMPDIVFFPKVIEGYDPFSITHFERSLNCYVPYSTYGDNNPELQYNRIFHNLLWKHYVATEIHLKISRNVNYLKSKNVVVSGYPGFDNYLFGDANYENDFSAWPLDGRKKSFGLLIILLKSAIKIRITRIFCFTMICLKRLAIGFGKKCVLLLNLTRTFTLEIIPFRRLGNRNYR